MQASARLLIYPSMALVLSIKELLIVSLLKSVTKTQSSFQLTWEKNTRGHKIDPGKQETVKNHEMLKELWNWTKPVSFWYTWNLSASKTIMMTRSTTGLVQHFGWVWLDWPELESWFGCCEARQGERETSEQVLWKGSSVRVRRNPRVKIKMAMEWIKRKPKAINFLLFRYVSISGSKIPRVVFPISRFRRDGGKISSYSRRWRCECRNDVVLLIKIGK